MPAATWGLRCHGSHLHDGVSQPWVTQQQPPSWCDAVCLILELLWLQLIKILKAKREDRQVTQELCLEQGEQENIKEIFWKVPKFRFSVLFSKEHRAVSITAHLDHSGHRAHAFQSTVHSATEQ